MRILTYIGLYLILAISAYNSIDACVTVSSDGQTYTVDPSGSVDRKDLPEAVELAR